MVQAFQGRRWMLDASVDPLSAVIDTNKQKRHFVVAYYYVVLYKSSRISRGRLRKALEYPTINPS